MYKWQRSFMFSAYLIYTPILDSVFCSITIHYQGLVEGLSKAASDLVMYLRRLLLSSKVGVPGAIFVK